MLLTALPNYEFEFFETYLRYKPDRSEIPVVNRKYFDIVEQLLPNLMKKLQKLYN